MHELRASILEAYRAALDAVDPETRTAEALGDLAIEGPAGVIAIGKAAPAMARGAAERLGDRLEWIIVASDHEEPVPNGAQMLVGDHPFPGRASQAAGHAVMRAARGARADQTVVFLISGGGSSLAEVPLGSATIADLAATARLAMNAGVPIDGLNRIRRHISAVKNGRLLAESNADSAVTLVLSDVIDSPVSDVASGPTLADTSTATDALDVLEGFGLTSAVPSPVLEALRHPAELGRPATSHQAVVIGDGDRAARAAAASLAGAGLSFHLAPALRGDAVEQAQRLCGEPTAEVTIASGETTMTVTGSGKGGRNQSAALAAAIAIDGQQAVFAALGTDGSDGPTDAAGAIVDGATAGLIRQAGLDPQGHLENDDAYPALDAVDALVRTGPTGTNVADLWFVASSS